MKPKLIQPITVTATKSEQASTGVTKAIRTDGDKWTVYYEDGTIDSAVCKPKNPKSINSIVWAVRNVVKTASLVALLALTSCATPQPGCICLGDMVYQEIVFGDGRGLVICYPIGHTNMQKVVQRDATVTPITVQQGYTNRMTKPK